MNENPIDSTLFLKEVNAGMVRIPGGRIFMKDDRIQKKWEAKIEPFYLHKYPVTQNLYELVTAKRPSTFEGEQKPVESVTWMDAILFCNSLSDMAGLQKVYTLTKDDRIAVTTNTDGFRLPTEAEWEFACKAGKNKPRYGDIDAIAWYKGNSNQRTHEVGLKEPNGWGLYDMLGNIWEWCTDIYDETVYGSYRIFRGGGWCDPERGCLATNRRRSHPFSFKIDDLGFRIARSR